jgi:hypothetical protein
MLQFYSDHFFGVHFEYKMQKRVRDSEDYMNPLKQKSQWKKMIKVVWVGIKRTLLCCKMRDEVGRFVKAKDEQYLKYVKAEFWIFSE